ncbi:MAG: ABC transporter ATP-binding protein [Planctomycetota bacterium]
MLLKRFITYYAPYRQLFALDMATASVHSACVIAIPSYSRTLLSRIEEGHADIGWIAIMIAVLGVAVVGLALTSYINTKWGHILGTRMETDMRRDLFGHLQKLSFNYYDKTKTGHIISRIANDLFNISELAHHGPEDLIISLLTFTGALILMFSFSVPLTLISLIPLAIMLSWGLFQGSRMRARFRAVRERIADINSAVENSIQGIREVKSFTNETYEMGKFHAVNSEFRTAKEKMYGAMAAFHSGMIFNIESFSLVVIAAGAIMVNNGSISFADIIGFQLFVKAMMNPVRRLTNFYEAYQQGAASFERFTEIMDIEPDIVDAPDAIVPPPLTGDIRIESMGFKYSSSPDWILKDINIHIPTGKTVALVGESGAGKSTLASLIPRFYDVSEGRILIDGYDIATLKQSALRASVGIVHQSVFLFDTTIRDNILFGRPDATEADVIDAARNANILDFILSLPDGLDTLVGERGVRLSGGQQQRVSIARVFLKNPPILIFDEATSSLDTESEELIQSAMEKLCENRTTIIIAHRLSTVKKAAVTYVLRGGRVVETGRHEELIASGGYYKELYTRSAY